MAIYRIFLGAVGFVGVAPIVTIALKCPFCTAYQLIVGQQSALGLSIQGISAAQLNTLKARMEHTKTTLQQAQAAPEDQRLADVQRPDRREPHR